MPPVAGMSGTSRLNFLVFDAGGSTLWSGVYIGAGFFFAKDLDKAARSISVFADSLILILGVPLLVFFTWKLMQLIQAIRLIRPLHITPEKLKERLDAGDKIALFDLLRFEDDPGNSNVIAGAMRTDPLEMRHKKHLIVPEGVDLVLYCGSRNSFVSARVAAAMRKNGIRRIWVLEGGLAAWKDLGFPMTTELADPQAEMKRLGVEYSQLST